MDTRESSSESEVPVYEVVDSRDETHSEWPMFAIRNSSKGKADEIMVPLKINNIPCNLELDTGAIVTVIPEDMWKNELGSVPLKESSVSLNSYSGHAMPMVGQAPVRVHYHAQEVNLPIIVTKGSGPSLMGRDWLPKVKLDWHRISNIPQTDPPKPKLEDIVQQYPKLFDGKLGTIKGFTAELKVKENAPPQYLKPAQYPMRLEIKLKPKLSVWRVKES